MQTITSQHLINFLPFDEKVRSDILADLDSFDEDQKIQINKTCWLLFYELVNVQTNYEYQVALSGIAEGKKKLTKGLYTQIADEVYLRLLRDLKDAQEAVVIDELRDKLKKMVSLKFGSTLISPQNKS